MLEFFLNVFAVLFIAVGPIDNAAVYAGLGHYYTDEELKRMALRACIVATIVLLCFVIGGNFIFWLIDIELYSVKVGGGILLLLLSIQIVMEKYQGGKELAEEHQHGDLSVFPLAMPLIAGPAAITQGAIFLAMAKGDIAKQGIVIGVLLGLMVLSYILLRLAGWVTKLLGDGGAQILSRALGILLAAIAASLILNGLRESGVFGG